MVDARVQAAQLGQRLVGLAAGESSASPNSPRMACSDASGLIAQATATGLTDSASRKASQRAIASATGAGPSTAAVARQPRIEKRARVVAGAVLGLHPGGVGPLDQAGVPGRLRAQRPGPARPGLVVAEHVQRGAPDTLRPVRRRARLGLEADELALDLGPRAHVRGGARSIASSSTAAASAIRPASNSAVPSAGPSRTRASPSTSATARSSRPTPAVGSARPSAVCAAARRRSTARSTRAGSAALRRSRQACSSWWATTTSAASRRDEPVGDGRVQFCASLRGHARVRRVADQHVREAERLLARVRRPVGRDQPFAHEADEARRERRPRRRGTSAPRSTRAAGGRARRPAGARAARPARPAGSRAARSRRVRRRRPRAARGTAGCPRRGRRSGRSSVPAPSCSARARDASSPSASSTRTRPVALRRRPLRPRLQQLGARQAEHEDRRAAGERDDVVERFEQRRLGPVDVLDGDEQRPLVRDALQQAPQRPGDLLDRHRLGQEPERAQQGAYRRLVVAQELVDPRARVVARASSTSGW